MKPINNIMVCLDLTEADDLLIRYAKFLKTKIKDIEKVTFVHNIRFENTDNAKVILEKLDRPLGEIVSDNIYEQVSMHFVQASDFEIFIEEQHSTPAALARVAKINNIDLVLVGKKISYRGSGLVVEKLLRVTHFSAAVLLVPETAYHRITNILLPTDFSKNSRKGIAFGKYLIEKTGAKAICQHVFSIPALYFPSLPSDDMKTLLEKRASSNWEKFSASLNNTDLTCEFIFNYDKNVAQTIYDYAIRNNNDLIIINSEGRGGLASFVLGRVALQLIQRDLHVPLLVVK